MITAECIFRKMRQITTKMERICTKIQPATTTILLQKCNKYPQKLNDLPENSFYDIHFQTKIEFHKHFLQLL